MARRRLKLLAGHLLGDWPMGQQQGGWRKSGSAVRRLAVRQLLVGYLGPQAQGRQAAGVRLRRAGVVLVRLRLRGVLRQKAWPLLPPGPRVSPLCPRKRAPPMILHQCPMEVGGRAPPAGRSDTSSRGCLAPQSWSAGPAAGSSGLTGSLHRGGRAPSLRHTGRRNSGSSLSSSSSRSSSTLRSVSSRGGSSLSSGSSQSSSSSSSLKAWCQTACPQLSSVCARQRRTPSSRPAAAAPATSRGRPRRAGRAAPQQLGPRRAAWATCGGSC